MDTPLTRHARERMDERGVPEEVVEMLLACGRSRPAKNGARRIEFGPMTRAMLLRRRSPEAVSRIMARYEKVYLIVQDDCIVTVAIAGCWKEAEK